MEVINLKSQDTRTQPYFKSIEGGHLRQRREKCLKEEDTQTKINNGEAERERGTGAGTGRELVLRKALKLSSDPLQLQWDHYVPFSWLLF